VTFVTSKVFIKYMLSPHVTSSENLHLSPFTVSSSVSPLPTPLFLKPNPKLYLSQANFLRGIINWAINLGETLSQHPYQSTMLFASHFTKPHTSVLKPRCRRNGMFLSLLAVSFGVNKMTIIYHA